MSAPGAGARRARDGRERCPVRAHGFAAGRSATVRWHLPCDMSLVDTILVIEQAQLFVIFDELSVNDVAVLV